jgi:anti-anti-sigma factor
MTSPTVHSRPKVEQSEDVRIITFRPDGTRDAQNMLAVDLEVCTDGSCGCHLMLDFTHVEVLGSAELDTLVVLYKRVRACGGRLNLFNLDAKIYEVFEAANLQKLLGICRAGRTPVGGSAAVVEKETDGAWEAGGAYPNDPDKFVYSE